MILPPSTHFVFLFEILSSWELQVFISCAQKNLNWKTKLEIASKRMYRGINAQLHDVVRQMHTHTHTHTHKHKRRETIRTWGDSELFIKVSAFVKPSSPQFQNKLNGIAAVIGRLSSFYLTNPLSQVNRSFCPVYNVNVQKQPHQINWSQ